MEPSNNDYFEEGKNLFKTIYAKLREKAATGRWQGISPGCFRLSIDEQSEQSGHVGISLLYEVEEVWEWYIGTEFGFYTHNSEKYYFALTDFDYYLSEIQPDNVKPKLDKLFYDFLKTLRTAEGHIASNCGNQAHHCLVFTEYKDEELYNLFSALLDDIVSQLAIFPFQISGETIKLNREFESVKTLLEDGFGAPFDIIPHEAIINEKLKKGRFTRFPV